MSALEIGKAVDAVLRPSHTGLPRSYFWGSGKTCIHGVAHDPQSMQPQFFVRIGRTADQATGFARAFRVLRSFRESPLAGNVAHAEYTGELPGYGPVLVVNFVNGQDWSPSSGTADRTKLETVRRLLEALTAMPYEGLGLEARDEERPVLRVGAEISRELRDRLERTLASLRPAPAAQGQCISHGDLTVNNVLWKGDQPCVIDWDDVALSYPGRDLLSLRMSWLLRARGVRLDREEGWLPTLCDTSDDPDIDPLAADLKRIPRWREVLTYFLLTYSITWLHYCAEPGKRWAELLLDRLAPQR